MYIRACAQMDIYMCALALALQCHTPPVEHNKHAITFTHTPHITHKVHRYVQSTYVYTYDLPYRPAYLPTHVHTRASAHLPYHTLPHLTSPCMPCHATPCHTMPYMYACILACMHLCVRASIHTYMHASRVHYFVHTTCCVHTYPHKHNTYYADVLV